MREKLQRVAKESQELARRRIDEGRFLTRLSGDGHDVSATRTYGYVKIRGPGFARYGHGRALVAQAQEKGLVEGQAKQAMRSRQAGQSLPGEQFDSCLIEPQIAKPVGGNAYPPLGV
jgi:hypothetical protein